MSRTSEWIMPSFAPPSNIFGIVWPILYIIIIISFGYVFLMTFKKELPFIIALPFILNNVDKILNAENRELFIKGYESFDIEIAMLKGKKYSEMEDEEKQVLLTEFNEKRLVASPAVYMVFDTIKSKTIQYLTTTEYYQRKVNYYEMVPGRFLGDVLVTELKNLNDE